MAPLNSKVLRDAINTVAPLLKLEADMRNGQTEVPDAETESSPFDDARVARILDRRRTFGPCRPAAGPTRLFCLPLVRISVATAAVAAAIWLVYVILTATNDKMAGDAKRASSSSIVKANTEEKDQRSHARDSVHAGPDDKEAPNTERARHQALTLVGDFKSDAALRKLKTYAANIKPMASTIDVVVKSDGSTFRYLYKYFDGTAIWQNFDHRVINTMIAKSGRKEQRIRLIACYSGADFSSLAQNLANKSKKIVIAPTDKVHIYDDGELTIGPTAGVNSGKWREFRPSNVPPDSKR